MEWAKSYVRETFGSDLLAAVIVTIMLIPQSLAYALLAGLPAHMGLYASILPLMVYALLGSSRTLSVGPVAVVSLMTASAIGSVVSQGLADAATAAIVLAMLSGLMLLVMGFLRFGFLANFLSHPVVSGFINASGIVIALSQLRHLVGIGAEGSNLLTLGGSLLSNLGDTNIVTLITGVTALVFLFWARSGLGALLKRLGVPEAAAGVIARAGPVLAIFATTVASYLLGFDQRGVALVGEVPSGLPVFTTPVFDKDLWLALFDSALLISVIGFVESVSVGKTLAAKRRQRIDPNQELIALGGANVASSLSGGFPVTGGFSRSVVNFDAGARTQAASIMAGAGIALAALLLTPALLYLPKATLAATIVVAVTSLIDFNIVKRAWKYSLADFIAVTATISATLLLGVELGVAAGILLSIALHIYKTSRPHMAVVGVVAGTEHYRNVERHNVITYPNVISLRVDESLYFANASFLEEYVYELVASNDELQHIILQCTAVNEIDLSALEVLDAIDQRLQEQGLTLNLSEVKGPVMDALEKVDFLPHMSGKVYLSHHQAVTALKTELIEPYII